MNGDRINPLSFQPPNCIVQLLVLWVGSWLRVLSPPLLVCI